MIPQRKKIFALRISDFVDISGERGIRTHGEFPHTCFQDKRLKPLGHLSESGINISCFFPPDKSPPAYSPVSARLG